MTPLQVTQKFVERINAGDVGGLAALMTEDHRFIDSLGNVVSGREAMKAGWGGLFQHGARLPTDCPTVAVRRPSRGDARNGERHLQSGRLTTPGAPLDDACCVSCRSTGRLGGRVAGLRRQRADPGNDTNASLGVDLG